MQAAHPVVAFFNRPPAQWRIDVQADQNAAGGIAWAASELPTLIVILFHQWIRIELRLATRTARSPLRADNELKAYNQWLTTLTGKAARSHAFRGRSH